MNPVLVQILTFEGCPHRETARAAARAAISEFDVAIDLIEVDLVDPEIPPAHRGYPSPTRSSST